MRKDDWKEIAELVGIAAIVGSLIFVGLQMKQSQEIAIANQYQARFDSVSEWVSSVIQSESAIRKTGQNTLLAIQESNSLSADVKEWAAEQPVDELGFWLLDAYRSMKTFDNLHYQYRNGFLSEDAWNAQRATLKGELGQDFRRKGNRQLYLMGHKDAWRQPYQKMIDDLIAEIDSASN